MAVSKASSRLSVADANARIHSEHYEVKKFIGEGGMACVFLAQENGTPNQYAFKILRDEYFQNSYFLKIFQREAAHMRDLQYPNIVRFYNFVQAEQCAYIVMEYVDGSALSEYLRANKQGFPVDEAVRVMAQIARAINYLHKNNYIHRDIKAGNILLRRTDGCAYLTDLGIILGSEESDKIKIAGTRSYMPCEQQRNQSLDHTADIYSFGIVVYEMLAGRRPFVVEKQDETGAGQRLTEMHCTALVPSLREFRPELPVALDPIFKKVLAKKSAERYQNVMDFAREVHQVLLPQLSADLKEFDTISPHPLQSVRQLPAAASPQKATNRAGMVVGLLALLVIVVTAVIFLFSNGYLDGVLPAIGMGPTGVLPLTSTAVVMVVSPPVALTETVTSTTVVTDNIVAGPTLLLPTLGDSSSSATLENRAAPAATAEPVQTKQPPTETAVLSQTVPTANSAVTEAVLAPQTDEVMSSATSSPTPTATFTLPPTLTPTATATATNTLTLTPTLTPTFIPTTFLNGEALFYIAEDAQIIGLGDDFAAALQLIASESTDSVFVPLRVGAVNGFRVDVTVADTAGLRFGVAYRVQDAENFLLFSVMDSTWYLEEVRDGVFSKIDSGAVTAPLDHIAVSGLNNYFRFELGNTYIQDEQNTWEVGSLGLWFEHNQSDFRFIKSVRLGLLGEEAVQAAKVAPTVAPVPVNFTTFLLADVKALQSAGSANAVIDCDRYDPVYKSLERHLTRPTVAALAREVLEIGALIYNRCQLDAQSGKLDMNDNFDNYLNWETSLKNIAQKIEIARDREMKTS
ncbi:MAG TPA: serine/threonine-protein kinase [Phototrophicaceae bacterium]|nr:serine/threonine-protein kinase [Phototrophicaceae bacterium]